MVDQKERYGRDIGLFLVLALAYRIGFFLAMPRVIAVDAIRYAETAQQLGAGDFPGLDIRIPMLYPAICALVHGFVGDLELACRLVSLMASALLVAPVYVLARALHGLRAARIAALVVSIWPWLADFGSRVAPESLYVLLWFSSLWAFARSIRHGGWWLLAAPASFFLLHLCRPEGTFLLLAAPLGGLILCARTKNHSTRRLVPYILISGVLLAGYACAIWAVSGDVTIAPRVPSVGAGAQFLYDRGLLVLRSLATLMNEQLPVMLGVVLLLFAGAGFFARGERVRDGRLESFVLFFAVAQLCLAAASSYAHPRYIMPLIVCVLLWSARGIDLVSGQARGLAHGRLLGRLPVAAVVAFMGLAAAGAVAHERLAPVPQTPREYKIAGLWMKRNLEPGLVMVRKPQIGYYADMPTVGPADGVGISETVALARKCGARYLVIDERYTARMIPGLAPLLDPKNAPAALELIKADLSPYPTARVVVYRIIGEKESAADGN
ncbi:MAG TPA: hypothetical protein HPP83_07230 [Candidatus Hydrogenedentes bacterium]|nr:hypothetical protein [Candidatus Hydrogenedentota bacterium]